MIDHPRPLGAAVAPASPPAGPGVALTIIIPARDEGATVEAVVRGALRALEGEVTAEALVVDGGSGDGTPEILRRLAHELPVRSLRTATAVGYGRSLRLALEQVTTPWVAFVDGDGQYDATDLLHLWGSRPEGPCLVLGRRVHRVDPRSRRLISYGFAAMHRVAFGGALFDPTTSMKLGPTPQVREVARRTRMNGGFWQEFMVHWRQAGMASLEVPVRHLPRREGHSRLYAPSCLLATFAHQFRDYLRLVREYRAAASAPSMSRGARPATPLRAGARPTARLRSAVPAPLAVRHEALPPR